MKLNTDRTRFDARRVRFAPFHHLDAVHSGSYAVALREDLHAHPFVLAGNSLRRRLINAQSLAGVVIPHTRIGKDHQRTVRVPLVGALFGDFSPETDSGVIFGRDHF